MSQLETVTVHTLAGGKLDDTFEAQQTLFTSDEANALVAALRAARYRAWVDYEQHSGNPVSYTVTLKGLSGAEVDTLIKARRGRRKTG